MLHKIATGVSFLVLVTGTPNNGDYQQYMNYQKYMDFQKYTGQGGQGGGSQQYMDYHKYMKGQGGGSQGSNNKGYMDYQTYMDYQKYVKGQAGTDATSLVAMDSKAKQPLSLYSQDVSQESSENNGKGKSQEDYMKEYAGAYVGGSSAEGYGIDKRHAPHSASDCHTNEQLHAWYEARKQTINDFVPQSYRDGPLKRLLADYEKNKDRIQREATAVTTTAPFYTGNVALSGNTMASMPPTGTLLAGGGLVAMIASFYAFVVLRQKSHGSEASSYTLLG